MVQSRLTKTLATITKKIKWPENKSIGYEGPDRKDKYLNPMLTPPPRSPKSPEDFLHHRKLGHWQSMGYDYTSPTADKYYYHEACGGFFLAAVYCLWLWSYGPDFKLKEWSKREAYLRTYKREALGLPLIDKNIVDPDRVVLPTEEELGDYPVSL